MGGDEFAVIIPGSSAADSYKVMERLVSYFNSYKNHDKGIESGILKCSIGIAEISRDFSFPERLIKAADEAMYNAKCAGGNRTVIASQNYHS